MYINSIRQNTFTPNQSFGRTNLKNFMKVGSAAVLLSSLAVCMNSCREQTSGDTFVNSQKVSYSNTEPGNKQIIINTLKEFHKKIRPDNDFISDVNVLLIDDFEHLDTSDSFYKQVQKLDNMDNTKGLSFYSDKTLPKQIIIQESAHDDDKIRNLFAKGKFSSEESLKHSLAHEIGHQFDSYFGHNHNDDFALKHDSLIKALFDNPNENPLDTPTKKEDIITTLNYNSSNGLSDKSSYKTAFLKDLQGIAKIKKSNSKDLPENIEYFVQKIDFNNINDAWVEIYDFSRSEVYANLFSYALGYDDGDRDAFLKAFPNSYKCVKKDTEKYLK